MSKLSVHSPLLPPVAKDIHRPLWSVVIPTYNCAIYLGETLKSVMQQALPPEQMQIVVVDNCSTDNTEEVVREIGGDRVEYFRQSQNVGSLGNFQTCLEIARGELIHTLHSDDCVAVGFYEAIAAPFLANPYLGAAFSRFIYIDAEGQEEGISCLELNESGILPASWIEKLATNCVISVPSVAVVRRSVYENIGVWDDRCGLSGDWEIWVRIAKHYPIWFETRPLAMWRRHSSSNNATNAKSLAFIQENYRTTELILSHLEQPMRDRVSKIIKRNCGFLALQSAEVLFGQGNKTQGFDMLKTALSYSFSFPVLRSSARILGQYAIKG